MENNQNKATSIFRIVTVSLLSYSIILFALMLLACHLFGPPVPGESCVSIMNRKLPNLIISLSIIASLIGGFIGYLWKIDTYKLLKTNSILKTIIISIVLLITIFISLCYISSMHNGYPLIKMFYYFNLH